MSKQKDMIHSKILYEDVPKTASILFIVLFAYAATSKFIDFTHFNTQLSQFPILANYATWIAWSIPILQLVIATLFIFPKFMLPAFYASLVLMCLLSIYIIGVLTFSNDVPCSCAGILALGWKEHLLFNMAFIVLAGIGILIMSKQKKHDIKKYITV